MSLGKLDEAQAALEASIELYEKLSEDFSDQSEYAVELAGTYTNLARLWGDGGKLEPSLPVLAKSIDVLEACRQKNPTLNKIRNSLLIAYWTRAMTLCGLMRHQESLADWRRAIELDDGQYEVLLRVKLVSALLCVNDFAAACETIEAVVNSSQATPEDLYLAGCTFAIAAGMAADDAALAETYATRSVALLEQAFTAGCEGPARLNTNTEFEPLRSRPDFQAIRDRFAGPAGESGSP